MSYNGTMLTYQKMDKAHLVAACRKRGIDTEGTKDELVQRLEQWAAANGDEPEEALIDEEELAAITRELEQKEAALEHL
eukprot:COSAG02_NODE_62174_length_266_cov_0.994012_1_plen_78_part_01